MQHGNLLSCLICFLLQRINCVPFHLFFGFLVGQYFFFPHLFS